MRYVCAVTAAWIVALWAPLLVPRAPDDASPSLRDVVWPALRAAPAVSGWTPRAVDEAPPGDAPALARRHRAGGVLWAEADGDDLQLRLYRLADDRVFEAALVLPPGAPAGPAREAVTLKLHYLLEARGGRPWRRTPPLPAPAPTVPARHVGDLEPPSRPPWPRRAQPAVPDPPPPLPEPPPPPGTRVELRVDEGSAARGPSPPGGWGVWFALCAVADTERVEPGFVLGARQRLVGRWSARLQGSSLPFAGRDGADASALQADVALAYRLWDAPVRGDAYVGAFYGRLLVGESATADPVQRGGALAGAALGWPVLGPFAVGVHVEVLAGSSALEASEAGARVARQEALQARAGIHLSLSADETGPRPGGSKEAR